MANPYLACATGIAFPEFRIDLWMPQERGNPSKENPDNDHTPHRFWNRGIFCASRSGAPQGSNPKQCFCAHLHGHFLHIGHYFGVVFLTIRCRWCRASLAYYTTSGAKMKQLLIWVFVLALTNASSG